MEPRDFDQMTRAMAAGVSRRSVFRRVVGSALVGPLALMEGNVALAQGNNRNRDRDRREDRDKRQDRGNGGPCRDVGHPCVGNQECCAGLDCAPTGPGSVLRCALPGGTSAVTTQSSQTVFTNNQVCAGDCDQTNQQAAGGPVTQTVLAGGQAVFSRPPSYWVDVYCQFEAPRYQTICTCTGHGETGAPPVHKITLPPADICAVIITEESRPESVRRREGDTTATGGQASAGTGGVANADASGGTVTIGDVRGDSNAVTIDASGGTASADASGGDNNVAIAGGGQLDAQDARQTVELSTLTLTLEGQVVPGRPATYWLETETGRRPAPGPALVQVVDDTAGTGAIIAEAMVCDITEPQQGYDWFGLCTTPATNMRFGLYATDGGTTPLATMETNAQGRAQFGNLTPGTYNVQPEGPVWCYAESDRVDANGNVLVEADAESHVWSFICGAPAGS